MYKPGSPRKMRQYMRNTRARHHKQNLLPTNVLQQPSSLQLSFCHVQTGTRELPSWELRTAYRRTEFVDRDAPWCAPPSIFDVVPNFPLTARYLYYTSTDCQHVMMDWWNRKKERQLMGKTQGLSDIWRLNKDYEYRTKITVRTLRDSLL